MNNSACIVLLAATVGSTLFGQPPKPTGMFATGRPRNLFVEAGYPPEIVTAKIRAAFQQLFHGDKETQAVYFAAGKNERGPLAYILDVGHGDVRSEGISYGMMIAVQLDKQAEFDALWNWAKTYMYHSAPTHPARGYFTWSAKPNGTPNDEMPAADGEEYFVTALYFASARWGDGAGIYKYRAEADRLLTDMLHRETITGQTVAGSRTAGNMFDPQHVMVRFSPDTGGPNRTDPSYHLPAFYELWARWGPKADRPFWLRAAAASREYFHRVTNPTTGLSPEYSNFDGTPWRAPFNPGSADFRFDACRTAMNWSMDWAWWAADPQQQELSDRIQAFFESQGITRYGNQYTLDGKRLGEEHATALVAANAVAGLAATHPRARPFVHELWEAPIPTGKGRYYDGMIYLLGLLHCGGDFRIFTPEQSHERERVVAP